MALSAHRSASSPPALPKHARRRLLISDKLRLAHAGSLKTLLRLRAMRADDNRSFRAFFVSKSSSSVGSKVSFQTSEGVLSSSFSSSEKSSLASLIFCSRRGRCARGPLITRGNKSALSAVKYSVSPLLRLSTLSSKSMTNVRSATPPSSYPSWLSALYPDPGSEGSFRSFAEPT